MFAPGQEWGCLPLGLALSWRSRPWSGAGPLASAISDALGRAAMDDIGYPGLPSGYSLGFLSIHHTAVR